MAAGSSYYKKGSTPVGRTGFTGIFAGADGLLRSVQEDGSVAVIQSSGIVAGSGLFNDGLATHISGGPGILVSAETVAVDFSAVQASGNYVTLAQAGGLYEVSGTVASRQVIAGQGLTGGGALSGNVTLNIGAGTGIQVNLNDVQFDTSFGDVRYALSGTIPGINALAGSGLYAGAGFIHVGAGSGIYLQDNLFGVDFSQVQPSGNFATFAAGDARWEASGYVDSKSVTAGAGLTGGGAFTDPSVSLAVDFTSVQASGNYPTKAEGDTRYGVSGNYVTYAAGDVRYALSGQGGGGGGTGVPGSGLFQGGGALHTQPGWGLQYTPGQDPSGLEVNSGVLDARYALSGQGGSGTPLPLSGTSVYQEFSATSTYKWNHNLGARPLIQVFDSGHCLLDVAWCYSGLNAIELSFLGSITSGYINAILGPTISGTGGGASISLVVATSGQHEVKELIARIELTASSGTLHFQNIPQNFDHLEYKVRARSDGGGTNVGTSIMFNGDATAENYDVTTHYFAGDEANAVTHVAQSNEDTRRGGAMVGATEAAGLFSNIVGRIDWYSRNNAVKYWVFDSVWAQSTGSALFYKLEEAGRWNSNDAITNIEYDCDTGNFASGTIMELWGIKTQWVVTSGQYGSLNISNGLIVP